jgi:hypothetical protein
VPSSPRAAPPAAQPSCTWCSPRSSIAKRESTERQPFSIDGALDVEATTQAVESLFADALAAGPRAGSRDERRVLLREINEAIAAQVRAYYARPWAEGDPDAVVRQFVCECGDTRRDVDLELPVGVVANSAALAPGHDELGRYPVN